MQSAHLTGLILMGFLTGNDIIRIQLGFLHAVPCQVSVSASHWNINSAHTNWMLVPAAKEAIPAQTILRLCGH